MNAGGPMGDDRIGYCAIADMTFCGFEQPIIHNDEQSDLEEHEPGVCEYYDDGVAA